MKRKIITNRPNISSEKIASYKDFNKLLLDYKKVTNPKFIKNSKNFFKSLLAIAAVVSVILIFSPKEASKNNKFICPPLRNINIDYDLYTIDASKGGSFIHKTGSKITFPANAFVDKNGNEVKGNVTVKYREMKDIADIFVSGIPMEYDSSGSEYTFESAGMLEILAEKDGEQLYMNKGKNVDIEMSSVFPESKYNLYQLDTVKRNWTFAGKDSIYKMSEKIMNDSANIFANKKEIPYEVDSLQNNDGIIKPVKKDEDGFCFNIKVDSSEFPEISIYKNVKFQIAGDFSVEEVKFNSKILWNDVEINRLEDNKYLVTFFSANKTVKYVTTPVFEKGDYKDALDIYKSYLQNIKEQKEKIVELERQRNEILAKKRQKEIEEQARLEAEYQKSVEEAKLRQKLWEEENARRMAIQNTVYTKNDLVFRTFQVNGFGIWNCDNPMALPQGAKLFAKYYDKENNSELVFNNVYLAEKDRNAMFNYYKGKLFRFNPGKNNIVWGVTPEGYLAIAKKEEFDKYKGNSVNHNFNMTIYKEELKTVDDVRKLLMTI